MSEYDNYIKYINNNLKLSNKEDINFDLIFDALMEFCMKFNKYKFGKNYSSSKCFIHIRGGASIKFKFNRYGLFDKNITNDIDIVMIPFENNPNVRIKLIENFAIALRKEFPKYVWIYKINKKLTNFYLNNIKIFDVVFYDNVKPWFNDFNNSLDKKILSKNYNSIDDYFNNLKKMFESNLDNQETLEKVTFTSLEYDYQSLKLLIDLYNKKYIEDIKKLKDNNASEIKIYDKKQNIKNKIYRYKKKLFYLSHIMVHNSFHSII